MSYIPARNDPYQLVTDTILAHLERGTVPWRCPWNRSTGRPRNLHTGREYQDVNVLLLGLLHFPSPWWMTFRQAQEHRHWIVQAANQAGRAADFILGRTAVDSSAAPAVGESAEQSALPAAA